MNRFPSQSKGTGARRGRLSIGKTLVAATCALTLAFTGCSQKGGKTTKTVVPTNPETPNKVISKLDSLVKSNKGKGIVTGFLTGEGKTVASGLLKQASNAGGERRLLTKSEVPLTGATILIFNSLKATTAADTTLKTDSLGNYTVILPEGKYFGFAVYLDLETFQLVTTSIPNMNPKADTIVKMDTAIAIEDVTAPTVLGVYDANSANSDGIFLVGNVPDKNAKINITFSEPMNRDAIKGVTLGRIDTTNTSTSLVLADTVKGVVASWSGDSKELTLTAALLVEGAQYGLILPTTLKDLAKNPLEKEYKATFKTVKAADLAAIQFAVAATFPADKETLKPIQNPGLSFNRPVDGISILKGATIEPAITGYWEVNGARAVFIHKEPLAVGTTYKVSLPVAVTDLGGQALKEAFSYSFTVKDFEGAAKEGTGKGQAVALAVEAMFDAYLSADLGRFGAAFHPNFRMYDEDGTIQSKSEFLNHIRAEVGEGQALAAGIMAPVFANNAQACTDKLSLWKVLPVGGGDEVWVSPFVNPGQSPMVYDKDFKVVAAADLAWDKTGPRFTYKTKVYGFGPDMSKFFGPVNMDAARGDMRFLGDVLKQTSTVALEPVKMEHKTEFKVDAAVTLSATGDTAKLAVKMIGYEKFSRLNFREGDQACSGKLTDTSYQILKFILVNDGSKWLVASIVSPARVQNLADFNKAVDTKNFTVKEIKPIILVAPLRNDAMGADGKVTFKFKAAAADSVGGYLVGIAEDPKFCFGRPPVGALIFVKAAKDSVQFILNSTGVPEGTNAASILRRVHDLRLPGWDRVMFDNSITTLHDAAKGFGGVYNWKVIAIKDTSASQFIANGFNPDRFYGESDFGPTRGYFACKAFPQGDAAFNALQTAQNNFVTTQPVMQNTFADSDLDGVPDGIEAKYKTDPRNRNSYPDFRTDTDGDGLADFLEAMLDKEGTDSLVTKKADAAGVKAEIAKLVGLGIVWEDSDGDGFPNEIEMMMGFNPMDAMNNPGTKARASAPVGVFSGKFQMGGNLNKISFRLYSDSTKALMVAYTAIVGADTLIDTLKTAFHDMSGEVFIPVLLKTGPDAGKMLLMRGRYEANMSLIMGPIDMIVAPPEGSTAFGGGPYIGQFAASGRGEDVTNFLPGSNGGMTGPVNPIVTNPINQGPMGYRLPPVGTDTGAVIVFDGANVLFIDAFGDTLAKVTSAMFRSQPDGSVEFHSETRLTVGNIMKRTEAGGRIFYDGNGNWVLDGHFFQESDSAGIRKAFPGQMCARGAKAGMEVSAAGVKGTLKGWIAQDKSGSGFVANPINTQPVCDPAKGPCTTQPICDPAKGPCPIEPGTTNPTFGRPYVAGATNYLRVVSGWLMGEKNYIYVSLGGKVFRVKNDSLNVTAAKFPMCGQVVLKLEAIPAKDETDISKAAYKADSMALQFGSSSAVLAMEDQYVGGQPARLDKARDSQGNILANVFVVELRPLPPEYGKEGYSCPNVTGPIGPIAPCDPTKGPCPTDTTKVACDPTKMQCPTEPVGGGAPLFMGDVALVKAALEASGNKANLIKDSTGTVSGQVDINAGSIMVDDISKSVIVKDATGAMVLMVLSVKEDRMKLMMINGAICVMPRPAGPQTQPQPGMPVAFTGALDVVKAALAASQNTVGVLKDSLGNYSKSPVNPASLFKDQASGIVKVSDGAGALKFSFLADPADRTKLAVKDGLPMTVPEQSNTVQQPADTTKPAFYKGSLSTIESLMNAKGWKAVMPTPQGPVTVELNDVGLKQENGMTMAMGAGSTKVYIFLGDKVDPYKPALSPMGDALVMERIVTAGP